MFSKKSIAFFILILIISIGVVSAEDNATSDDVSIPTIEVPEKIWKDWNSSITIESEEPAAVDISGSITYNTTVSPGKTSIPIKNLSAGRHSIHINSSNTLREYNITVLNENPDWNMDFECLGEGERLYGYSVDHEMMDIPYYVLNAPEGLTGNFSLYVNGELYDAWNALDYNEYGHSYGTYIEPKVYNFTLKYSGDDYFYEKVKTKIVEYTTTLINIPEEVIKGYDDTLYITSEYDFSNANITIKVNNETVFEKNNLNDDYYYSIEYSLGNLEVNRTYDIEVNFTSDYIQKTKRATVNVSDRIKDYITFYGKTCYDEDSFKFNYGDENCLFYINSPELNLNFTIDGKKYLPESYDYDEYAINISDLNPGRHTISVSYKGDDKYAKMTFTQDFEVVAKAQFERELNQDDMAYLTLILPEDAQGTLSVDFMNLNRNIATHKTIDVAGSHVSVELPTEHAGYCQFEAYFTGNYELNEIAGKYFIKDCAEWSHNENYWPTYLNQNKTLTLTMPNDGFGKLTVRITRNGESYKNMTFEVTDGTCNIRLPTEHMGEYSVTTSFEGNYELNPYSEIYEVESEYSIEVLDEYGVYHYNNDAVILLELPEDGTGTLTLEIKYGKDDNYTIYKSVKLNKGYAEIKVPTNRIGIIYYNAYYSGNYELYNITDAEATIVPDYQYKNHIFTLIGPENLNGTFSLFNWNSEDTFSTDVVNGKASIDITNYLKYQNEEATLDLTFTSEDGERYDMGGEFEIMPIYDIKLVAKDTTSYYGISKYIEVKVYRNGKLVGSGQKITIKIGSKTYYAKTNKKGIVKLKISQIPGKYTVKITYKGKSISKKLKVKQTLTLKKATIQKSAKKLILTATLKKGKTPIKGKKITFKFKGKTYTAKTNKKGIAKVTIKKSVLKKLKVGKKVTYTAKYLKNTVKKTVKIKR